MADTMNDPTSSSFDLFADDQPDDQQRAMASVISPQPASALVGPPPDVPPDTQPGVSTPRTGNLAAAPQQAVAKNRDNPATLQQSPIGAVAPAGSTAVPQAQMNPDPNSSLRPGGTNPMPAIPAASPAPSQLDRDQSRLAYLTNSGSGIDQIHNRFGRIAARIGDIALTQAAPGVAQWTPGTTLNHQRLVGQQQGIVGNDQAQLQQAAALQDTQQQTAQRAATAAKDTALAGADTPRAVTADEAKVAGNAALEGSIMRPSDIAKLSTRGLQNAGNDDTHAMMAGMKPSTDASGNKSYVADPDSPVYQAKQAQAQLAQAKAELARAGNDPRSPAYQLALKKANTAQVNASAATTRATAYMGQYLQRAYNKGLGGDTLPGAPQIGNDEGDRTVVGTGNAPTAIRNQANVAQFNDVHGALDSLEGSAKALVQSGGKLNSPRVAAALAQPPGTLGKWLQGEGAKSGLTPQERDYVIANAAAHENIQAMRKAAGGTATDSSVAKLDALIPGASTPDIDYFLRQTGQIRSTAQRLGTGVTTAAGGSNLRNPVPQANPGGSLKGPVRPGEQTAVGPNNHTIVVRGNKWVDPQTGLEAK